MESISMYLLNSIVQIVIHDREVKIMLLQNGISFSEKENYKMH